MWTGDMAQVVLDRTYAYRSDGTPTEIADSSRGTRRFQADAAGRVTAVTGADWRETYAYDAFGNLAHASTPGRPDTAGERVTDRTLTRQAGRTSYEHDAAGRLVRTVRRTLDGRRLVSEYTWNADDRLIRVELPDGAVWRYSYDPFGRRTGKHRSGPDGAVERYTFVWDGPRLTEQQTRAADGSVTALTWDYDPGSFRPCRPEPPLVGCRRRPGAHRPT
jgi:YD repeat-containing protein